MATHSSILAWRISMDRGAWWAAVPGVAKSQTRLSDFHFPVYTRVSASTAIQLETSQQHYRPKHFLKLLH